MCVCRGGGRRQVDSGTYDILKLWLSGAVVTDLLANFIIKLIGDETQAIVC